MTETPLMIAAILLYVLSAIFQVLNKTRKHAGRGLLIAAAVLHLGLLVLRSLVAKHPPFTDIYETFLLLPFLISLRLIIWPEQAERLLHIVLTAVSGLFLLTAVFLPAEMKAPEPLMPALNSFWMYIHVPAYFFAYMALIFALAYALMILLGTAGKDNERLRRLQRKMDTEIRIAFFFLNAGLLTGAVWAYVSWGNYWSWDPKETWALINILILAFALHLRVPTARKKAWIVIIAVLSVAFTYWGVSFILSGLHSYI